MAEEQHHHHPHHRMDGASKFKRKQLQQIETNKMIRRWLWRGLCIVAAIAVLLMVAAYTIG